MAVVSREFVPFQNQRVRLIAENVNSSSPKVKVDRLRFSLNVRPKDLGNGVLVVGEGAVVA